MKNKNIKGELYNIFDNLIYSSFDNVADKVKNNKGVVLNMKKENNKKLFYGLGFGFACVIMLFIGIIFFRNNSNIAVIGIDVNPSLELSINSKNKVVSVNTNNADAISKKMGISLKTVYRELEILKDLQENMGFVLNSKIGKGFKISFDVKSRETIQKSYVQEARYLVLKNYLLRTAPKVISLEELSNMFFISKASILSDLKKVDYDLKKYNLIIIKHNKGVTIEGTEFEIRRALANSIIKSDYKEADFLDSFSSRFDETTRISLCSQFSSELVDYIEQVVKEIEKDLGYEITDPYYINIVTHLLIMVLRLMRGRPLETEKPVLLSPDIHKMRIAFSIANKIEKRYRINIPDNDVRYIYEIEMER